MGLPKQRDKHLHVSVFIQETGQLDTYILNNCIKGFELLNRAIFTNTLAFYEAYIYQEVVYCLSIVS